MKKLLAPVLALCAACAIPMASAQTFTFNAVLDGPSEVPPNGSLASGIATLLYDTHGTAALTDDTYDFAMSVFDLSASATGYHIHGAASTTETAPVRVALDAAPFVNLNLGSTLLVGGDDVAVPSMIPATPATATNQGYPEMSFLAMLQSGLGYVNVHTPGSPGGEVRGQLLAVTAVPEPGTWAMLLAGLGVVAGIARRRQTTDR